jgi:TonB family protein
LTVCRTYVDEAKSGIEIKRRQGLSQLLQDVLGGNCQFKSILVYDVSRWGRFQDPDEAAHYEFLCKTAGVRVHYCAEHFGNDTYLPNVVLKALKRVMAGEYSRELSDKVFAALIRLARDGYRAGGYAGYGLRRMLLSVDKTPKGQLLPGERKNVTNERVTLAPGPANEIYWVREKRMNIAGAVKVLVTVLPNGTVKEAKLLGGHPVLATAALDAVRKWRFEAGPVESTGIVEFRFDPNQ